MTASPNTCVWDDRYAQREAVWGYFPSVSAEEAWWRLRGTGGRRVLVSGCGYGRHVVYFARRGLDTTGIDSSRPAIEMALETSREDGLEILLSCASATRMPFPHASFDAVYDHALLHHLCAEDRDRAIAEYRRVLRPGGLLVVSELSVEDADYGLGPEVEPGSFYGADGRLEHFFGRDELTALLDGFIVESMIEVFEPAEDELAEPRRFVRAVARRFGERELCARSRRKWGRQKARRRLDRL